MAMLEEYNENYEIDDEKNFQENITIFLERIGASNESIKEFLTENLSILTADSKADHGFLKSLFEEYKKGLEDGVVSNNDQD